MKKAIRIIGISDVTVQRVVRHIVADTVITPCVSNGLACHLSFYELLRMEM